MSLQQLSPGSRQFKKYIADALGLTLLVDVSVRRYKPEFITADTLPKDRIRLLPKAHWRVMR